MAAHASDVTLAAQLVDHVDLPRWARIAEGLMQSPPRIHDEDAEHLDDLMAWVAGNAPPQPRSHVDAAVVNAERVLSDLLLVMHYEMDWRDDRLWVTQWYRTSRGQPGHARRLEQYNTHVALIDALVVESTRAWNLVIDRVRRAAPDLLEGVSGALAPTGPSHAPAQALRYGSEQVDAQPYPGLAAFPATIRDGEPVSRVGALAEFTKWVAHVAGRDVHSEAPLSGPLPFALPVPDKPSRPATTRTRALPPAIAAACVAVTAAAAIAGVLAAGAFFAGATAGLAVSTGVLHRRVRRWPPEWRAAAIVVAVTATCGALSGVLAGLLNDTPAPSRSLGQNAAADILRGDHPLAPVGDIDRVLARSVTPVPGQASPLLGYGSSVGDRDTLVYSNEATQGTREPVLNSMVDLSRNNWEEDERRYMQAWGYAGPAPSTRKVKAGRTIEATRGYVGVRPFVDNNAAPTADCSRPAGTRAARNVRLRVAIWSDGREEQHVVRTWFSSDNTKPAWVTDAVLIQTPGGHRLVWDGRHSGQYTEGPPPTTLPVTHALFEPGGAPVGTTGVLGSCWSNRVWFFLAFAVR
jgi:hypothetical protein